MIPSFCAVLSACASNVRGPRNPLCLELGCLRPPEFGTFLRNQWRKGRQWHSVASLSAKPKVDWQGKHLCDQRKRGNLGKFNIQPAVPSSECELQFWRFLRHRDVLPIAIFANRQSKHCISNAGTMKITRSYEALFRFRNSENA